MWGCYVPPTPVRLQGDPSCAGFTVRGADCLPRCGRRPQAAVPPVEMASRRGWELGRERSRSGSRSMRREESLSRSGRWVLSCQLAAQPRVRLEQEAAGAGSAETHGQSFRTGLVPKGALPRLATLLLPLPSPSFLPSQNRGLRHPWSWLDSSDWRLKLGWGGHRERGRRGEGKATASVSRKSPRPHQTPRIQQPPLLSSQHPENTPALRQ